MSVREKVLVTGAGGFIGSHLVTFLKRQGYWVRGVDLKYPEFTSHTADDYLLLDLRTQEACLDATRDIEEIYALAADTDGSSFQLSRKVDTTRNNLLINLHMLEAARTRRVSRYLFPSTTVLWSDNVQLSQPVPVPNTSQSLLFHRQLFSLEQRLIEQLCLHYQFDFGIKARVIRLPTIFGPFSPWQGGREHILASLCYKVAVAKFTQTTDVEVWGDGTQRITLCYIEDCVAALAQAMHAAHPMTALDTDEPPVSIDQLADLLAQVAGISIVKRHISVLVDSQESSADNTNLPRTRGSQSPVPLAQGLASTYAWIEERVRAQFRQEQTP